MINRIAMTGAIFALSMIPSNCPAQTTILSTAPPKVEYQYQMYYPRLWGWPGPGLSIGGSLPSTGREGISSFYGRPFPVPLGAGVYMNPFAYSTQLPGPPNSFGLAATSASPTSVPAQASQPLNQVAGVSPANLSGSGLLPAMPQPPQMIQSQPQQTTPMQPPQTMQAQPQQSMPARPDFSNRPVRISSIATLEKGRQIIGFGDEKLQNHQWMQAYVNYRNAVLVADDLADAHVRLAIASLALNRFPEATVEFKRALMIDPTAARPGDTLASILGPESRTVRNEITRNVALWTREDLRDQDRLFLLGAVLHFNEDKRAPEILEAAYKLTGSGDHLLALMASPSQAEVRDNVLPPVPNPPESQMLSDSQKLPELYQRPLALH